MVRAGCGPTDPGDRDRPGSGTGRGPGATAANRRRPRAFRVQAAIVAAAFESTTLSRSFTFDWSTTRVGLSFHISVTIVSPG